MRKLFGRDKPKVTKVTSVSREEATGLASTYSEDGHYTSKLQPSLQRTSPPAPDRGFDRRRSLSHDNWEVVSPYDESSQFLHRRDSVSRNSSFISLPPGASPPTSSPLPRSSSPFSVASHPSVQIETTTSRKKPPGSSVAALGILKALEPQNDVVTRLRSRSEEHLTVPSEATIRAKKRTFWDRQTVKDRERDQERGKDRERRDEEVQAELTKMIGYLTATSSEDWSLVLEVCERASASEKNAREAVRALRREFKYGEPSAQLSAARLWAIMLRNSSETFVSESLSRKFLDSIEDIIVSPRTSPVVRERLLDVVGAAAFASNSRSRDIRGDKEGFRSLWKRIKPVEKPDEGVPFDTLDAMFNPPASGPYTVDPTFLGGQVVPPPSPNPTQNADQGRRQKPASRDGVISLKEDMKRLFQECRIGQGNASLLSEALAFAKPEDLTKDIIREFYAKCRASQELICAQIAWATAGAERSRLARDRSGKSKSRPILHSEDSPDDDEPTTEEKLLAALLAANEALLEALRVHSDLENMAMERRVQDQSRTETRTDVQGLVSAEDEPRSKGTVLSAPPLAPHGPRLPLTSSPPRTPSPVTSDQHSPLSSPENGGQFRSDSDDVSVHDEYRPVPAEPSAKALGKRRVIEVDEAPAPHGGEDITYGVSDFYHRRYSRDSGLDGRWKRDVHYVYDAAAERTEQRIRDGNVPDL